MPIDFSYFSLIRTVSIMPEQIDLIDSTEIQCTCDHCSEDTTENNLTECSNCSTKHCTNCNRNCEDCNTEICDNCSDLCAHCSDLYCNHCIVCCDQCSVTGCSGCIPLSECSECEQSMCDDCHYYCCDSERSYCESCYVNRNTNYDLNNFHREILDYSTKVNWELFKENHENTVFLGIELECSFDDSNIGLMFDASEKALSGKHIWKHDSSVTNGAELVIAPHTLQATKKINFKKMLKEFSRVATSYESAECGLHVHVNRESLSSGNNKEQRTIEKLRYFFSTCRHDLIKFSQRNTSQLEQWCNIPRDSNCASWHERGCAINTQNEATIEFRLFRGTLDYDRFESTLQFCDAIVSFALNHSIAVFKSKNQYKLNKCFRYFLENNSQYSILLSYLNKKNLFN